MFNGSRDKSTCTAGTKRGGGESSECVVVGGGVKRRKKLRKEVRKGVREGAGGPFQGDLRGAHVVRFPCKWRRKKINTHCSKQQCFP